MKNRSATLAWLCTLCLASGITAFTVARAASPAAETETVKARVVKVDAARSKVTLNHERIQSIGMEAMVMPFKVKDKQALQGLKPGDRVNFSVVNDDGELVITRIGVVK